MIILSLLINWLNGFAKNYMDRTASKPDAVELPLHNQNVLTQR